MSANDHDDHEVIQRATPAFAIVPEWAIFTDRLTHAQYRVFTALCLYANTHDECWPKVETLARKVGISHQAISKTIRELAQLSLVRVEKFGFPARNHYFIYRGSQPPAPWNSQLQPVVATAELDASDAASCNPTLHQLQPHVASVATSEVAGITDHRTDHQNSVSQQSGLSTIHAPEARERVASPDIDAMQRDPLTLALITCLGHTPATPREWGQWRLALNDLHAVGATASAIPIAIQGYQAVYPKARITPLALVNHWSEIREGKAHDLAQLEISRRASEATVQQRHEQDRADAERRERERAEVDAFMLQHGYGARAQVPAGGGSRAV